jgi:hypothetical protein
MMTKKKLREARKARKQKEKIRNSLIMGIGVVGVIALLGLLVWNGAKPAAGEEIPIMANAGDHVEEGTDPGPFNSDPPTSGQHYGEEYDAGFYDENSPEAQVPYPEGFLGHNLEHGYVIYWYNCDLLDEAECSELKVQLQESMADNRYTKLIAFPRASLDVPVVLTTWGRMLRMDSFDASQASKFVSANRNRAPEPNAP